MKKQRQRKFLTTLSLVLLATPALAADSSEQQKNSYQLKDNGGYESVRSSTQTQPDGTKQTTETTVDRDVKSNGSSSINATTTVSTDPRGAMNEQQAKKETSIEEKPRGGYKETNEQKQTDAAGTNVTTKTTTDVDVDHAGNVTRTVKSEKTVDPKGLMNKETVTDEVKSVNGQVVDHRRTKD